MISKHIKNNDVAFVIILITLFLFFLGIVATLLYISLTSNQVFYELFLNIIILLAGIACVYSLINVFIIICIIKDKKLKIPRRWIQGSLRLVYPQIIYFSELLGFEKDRIRRVFSEINNGLILAEHAIVNSEEILIILPHCLQKSSCANKITVDINNCQQCRICDIHSFVEIGKRYGLKVYVATGGTLARKIVKEIKPRLIIAVACERDLISGILDIIDTPVIGILLERPEGPCINTKVNIDKIYSVIEYFIEKEGQLCSSIRLIMDSDQE